MIMKYSLKDRNFKQKITKVTNINIILLLFNEIQRRT